jgi:polar amino acid transport system substrate-binding protein
MRSTLRCLACILTAVAGVPALAQSTVAVCSVDYQPYTKSDQGEGIWAELVGAAFKTAGVTASWEVLPSARCNDMARKGSILAAFNSVKTFEADKDLVVFESPTMFNIDMVAFYDARKQPKGLEFDTIKDLGKYKVGLLQGTGSMAVFTNAGVPFQPIPSIESMVKMLDAGRLDVIVLGDLVGLYNFKKYVPESVEAFKYKSVYSSPVDLGFSTKAPGYKELFDKYQQGMKTIKKNGTYMSIFAKYYGGDAKVNRNSLAVDMK